MVEKEVDVTSAIKKQIESDSNFTKKNRPKRKKHNNVE